MIPADLKSMKQLVELTQLMQQEREASRLVIAWLYHKLVDYMSGSGSSEEEDLQMAEVKALLQDWGLVP